MIIERQHEIANDFARENLPVIEHIRKNDAEDEVSQRVNNNYLEGKCNEGFPSRGYLHVYLFGVLYPFDAQRQQPVKNGNRRLLID